MKQKQNFLQKLLREVIGGGNTVSYKRPEPQYILPPAISEKHRALFIEQANKSGVSPEEFGTIVKREQGATTTPDQVALIGGADPTDRGVMQVNKVNEPLIQKRFQQAYGRDYNPNNTEDSIIGAAMVLQENRRQFQQMMYNKTITEPYTSTDLVNSYNLGARGVIDAKKGDKIKQQRLSRYESAGLQ
jgi:hypothetical protein